MSEYRFDPLHQTWAVVAQQRSGRPADFIPSKRRRSDDSCPFCAGFESETPPEIVRFGERDYRRLQREASVARVAGEFAAGSGRALGTIGGDEPWRVRVVPNRYPAVNHFPSAPGMARRPGSQAWLAGSVARDQACELKSVGPAIGKHEVVIESPRHCGRLVDADESILPLAFAAYRARLTEFARDRRLAYASVFKNVGPEAGASLEHLHSQIVALPMAPPHVETTWQAAWEHRRREKTCMTCRLIELEREAGSRIVAETDGFIAWCPFASRFAYEVCVAPKRHAAHFHAIDGAELLDFAAIVRRAVERIERTTVEPQYNFVLQTAPFSGDVEECLHWRLEILPRTSKAAGFEWGTQCFINPVPPEAAAAFYRDDSGNGIDPSDSAASDADFRWNGSCRPISGD